MSTQAIHHSGDSEDPRSGNGSGAKVSDIHVPDHELIKRIGKGSYGEVWLGRNVMGSFRAVKFVFRHSFQDERPFLRELEGIRQFEPISRTHEGFVDILQIGQDLAQGYFYYVMELADDQKSGQKFDPQEYRPQTLDVVCKNRGRIPFSDCLHLGLSIADALSHLHGKNLVHRDVKPSNIIFVNGVPKLADIGLVAAIADKQSFVGTQGFIPPEGPGTPQADVYSLGKVLYEMSTGNDRTDFPSLPTLLGDEAVPVEFLELNAVVLKACHGDLDRRYATSRAMHAELLVLYNGKSVRRLRNLERRVRWSIRAGVGALIALALGIAAYLPVQARRTENNRRAAIEIGSQLELARRGQDDGDYFGAFHAQAQALRLMGTDRKAQENLRLSIGTTLMLCPKLTGVLVLTNYANCVDFSPDGTQLLLAEDNAAEALQIVDLSGGAVGNRTLPRIDSSFGPRKEQIEAYFSTDGERIVSGGASSNVYVWNSRTRMALGVFSAGEETYSCAISSDGSRVAAGTLTGRVIIWDVASGARLTNFLAHSRKVRHVEFGPKGDMLATASEDATARVWNLATGEASPPLSHKNWVFCVGFHPDGHLLVTSSFDHTARVWSTKTWKETIAPLTHSAAIRSARFSPDGHQILTSSYDFTARIWDVETGLLVPPMLRHSGLLLYANFSRDGRQIATAGANGLIYVWDRAISAGWDYQVSADFDKAGRTAQVETNGIIILSPNTDQLVVKPLQTLSSNATVRILNEGKVVALWTPGEGQREPQVELWDGLSSKRILAPTTATCPPKAAAANEKNVALINGRQVQLFNIGEKKLLDEPLKCSFEIQNVIFDHLGKHCAILGSNSFVVCDITSKTPLFPPREMSDQIGYFEFSPDDASFGVALRSADLKQLSAQVWRTDSGRPVTQPLRHRDGVTTIHFSPDGAKVLTTSEDATAILWDLATSKPIFRRLHHEDQIIEACFSHDGRWIVTTGRDRRARIWDASSGYPLSPWLPLLFGEREDYPLFINDRYLAVVAHATDGRMEHVRWPLRAESRDFVDLKGLGYLFGGVNDNADENPLEPSELLRAWTLLRRKFPSEFSASHESNLSWHLSQLKMAEDTSDWSAALFHLRNLQALRSDEASLGWRGERAMARWEQRSKR